MLTEIASIRFEHFVLDLHRRELKANGTLVPLQNRTCDLLVYLIERRDRAVTDEEIWTDFFGRRVTRENVRVHVSALRTAFEKAGGDRKLIVTRSGPAYQFTGRVIDPRDEAGELAGGAPSAARPAHRWKLMLPVVVLISIAAGLVGLWAQGDGRPAAEQLSIVVMPFRNLTDDRSLDFLATAITDDLATELRSIPASKVIARDSAVSVSEKRLTVQEIGRALRVRYVLSGSLMRTETGYRVNPDLGDTATGLSVWSQPFQIGRDRLGNLRDVIVRQLARGLNIGLDSLQGRLAGEERPDSPTAVDLYYQAVARIDQDLGNKSLGEAIGLLRQATDKDPNFVDALAKLGWALVYRVQGDIDADSDQDRQLARKAIQAALRLDPQHAGALAAHALELELADNCPMAEHVAEEALQWAASNLEALTVLRNCAWEQGRIEEAAAHELALDEIDPVSRAQQRRQVMQADIDLLLGKATEALTILTGLVADFPDADPAADPLDTPEYVRILLIEALELTGRHDEAVELWNEYREKHQNRSAWRIAQQDTRALSTREQKKGLLTALVAAGMPMYASKAAGAGAACNQGHYNEFTATPPALPPPGRTLQTAEVVAAYNDRRPMYVIDVGLGVAAYPGAKWRSHGQTPADINNYVDDFAGARQSNELGWPIVVMDNGPFGCAGYLAAEHLMLHYNNIAWYRDGEEGLAQTTIKPDDHRQY